jgi:hypothetical protein
MTTYHVLAEAAAFHRRRLAAAFMSGSPDGPRVEAPRAGRCVACGLVLAAVCVLGVVASGAVTGHPSLGWDDVGLHVSAERPSPRGKEHSDHAES